MKHLFAAGLLLLAFSTIQACAPLRGLELGITGKTTYTDAAEATTVDGAKSIVKRECKLPLDGIRAPFVMTLNAALAEDPEAVGEAGGPIQVFGIDCNGDGKPDVVPEPPT